MWPCCAALGIGLALGVLEVWLRVAEWWAPDLRRDDPVLCWSMRPNVALAWATRGERVNADGWRGPRVTDYPTGSSCRVAWLGASETFGVTIAEEADTGPRQLEHILRNRYAVADAEVYNYGVCEYSFLNWRLLMETTICALKPRFVVIRIGDGWDQTRMVGWHDLAGQLACVRSRWYASLALRKLYWISDPAVKQLRMSRRLRRLLGPDWLAFRQSLASARADFETILRSALASGITPIVLTYPENRKGEKDLAERYKRTPDASKPDLPWDVHNAARRMKYSAMVREVIAREGVQHVELDRADVAMSDDGSHPNAEGCRFMATRLAEVINTHLHRQPSDIGLSAGSAGGAP